MSEGEKPVYILQIQLWHLDIVGGLVGIYSNTNKPVMGPFLAALGEFVP